MIFIAKGTATMGITKRDRDGNIVEHTPAKFTVDDKGGSVAIGKLDPDDTLVKEPITSMYGDWDASGYLSEILDLLQPTRSINLPPLREIVKSAAQYGECPFLEHCPSAYCVNCCVREWIDEDYRASYCEACGARMDLEGRDG